MDDINKIFEIFNNEEIKKHIEDIKKFCNSYILKKKNEAKKVDNHIKKVDKNE